MRFPYTSGNPLAPTADEPDSEWHARSVGLERVLVDVYQADPALSQFGRRPDEKVRYGSRRADP